MAADQETTVLTLPPALPGDTTHFRLKGLPAHVVLRIRTEHGTEITAELVPHSEVVIFNGADRKAIDVEFVVPDSAHIATTLDRVAGPNERKGH